jgi:hypothetical protein
MLRTDKLSCCSHTAIVLVEASEVLSSEAGSCCWLESSHTVPGAELLLLLQPAAVIAAGLLLLLLSLQQACCCCCSHTPTVPGAGLLMLQLRWHGCTAAECRAAAADCMAWLLLTLCPVLLSEGLEGPQQSGAQLLLAGGLAAVIDCHSPLVQGCCCCSRLLLQTAGLGCCSHSAILACEGLKCPQLVLAEAGANDLHTCGPHDAVAT